MTMTPSPESVTHLEGPLTSDRVRTLRAGDSIRFSGTVFTARDAAHRRLVESMDKGEPLPFPIRDSVIYFAGPAPAKPGQPIGSIGPTSSYRMDAYSPRLLDAGLTGMIGKGTRSPEVIEAMRRNGAVYFAAIGGAAALIARCVRRCDLICYEDLGPEAIRRLEVVEMPLVVAIDCEGGNLYEQGPAAYLESLSDKGLGGDPA